MVRVAKVAFVASFFLLNVYLAWASFLLRAIWPPLYTAVNHAIRAQDIAVWTDLHLSKLTYYTQVVADFEALAILLVLMVSAARLSREGGRELSVIRSVQVAALCFAIEGAEVGLFDYKEFFLHFTDATLAINFAAWFTNADLLLASLAVLGATVFLSGSLSGSTRARVVAIAAAVALVASVVGVAYMLLPVAYSTTTTTTFVPASAFLAILHLMGLRLTAPTLRALVSQRSSWRP